MSPEPKKIDYAEGETSGGHWCDSEMIGAMPDMMFRLDSAGRFVGYHCGPESELYLHPSKFLGKSAAAVLPLPVGERLLSACQNASKTHEIQTVEYMLPERNGLVWYEARIRAIEGGDVLVIVRDINEARQIKTRLEGSEARFRALVSNVPGAIYRMCCDKDWTTSFISDAIESIAGYPASDFVNSNVRSFASVIHPEDQVRVDREVHAALAKGMPFDLEYRIIHANGSVRWVSDNGQAVRLDEESEVYLDGVILDTTEWRFVQQKLLVNRQMASVGALAAGVAHEINNPLAIIMANLEYAVEELGDLGLAVAGEPHLAGAVSDVSLAVGKIGESVDRVRRIIADLRSFSDAAEQHAARVNVGRVMEWAVHRLEEGLRSRGTIQMDLDEVPLLWANELGLLQVFSHLLSNAAQALDDEVGGQIKVRIIDDSEEERIVIEVSDNGRGMSEETLDRIFEPFFTTQAIGDGTGLGLFVSRGIVEGMGGQIEVASELGRGSLFRVFLPV